MAKKEIYIEKKIFDKKLKKAKDFLLEKGIISLDGSGDADIEGLFTMLRWFEKGILKIN